MEGITRFAEHVGRYYPALLDKPNDLEVLVVEKGEAAFEYSLPWDQLYFEKSSGIETGQLAVAQRIFRNNQLVYENLEVYQPRKPTKKKRFKKSNMSAEALSLELALPVYFEGEYSVEFVAIDLLTGSRSHLIRNINL